MRTRKRRAEEEAKVAEEEEQGEKEDEEEEEEEEDEEGGLSAYEQLRLRNIQQQQEWFAELGLDTATGALRASAAADASTEAQKRKKARMARGLQQQSARKKKPAGPMRRSSRIKQLEEGGADAGGPSAYHSMPDVLTEMTAPRVRIDDPELEMNASNALPPVQRRFLQVWRDIPSTAGADLPGRTGNRQEEKSGEEYEDEDEEEQEEEQEADSQIAAFAQFGGLRLREDDVFKAVPLRTTSMCWNPSADTLLLALGDKRGNVGICHVDSSDEESQAGVFLYRPHLENVSYMDFDPTDAHRLLTVSYDGTVRVTNLHYADTTSSSSSSGSGFSSRSSGRSSGSSSNSRDAAGNTTSRRSSRTSRAAAAAAAAETDATVETPTQSSPSPPSSPSAPPHEHSGAAFRLVYEIPEDLDDVMLQHATRIKRTPSVLVCGRSDGTCIGLDLRAKPTPIFKARVHDKKVNYVDVNDVHEHVLATASGDTVADKVRIWDMRTFGSSSNKKKTVRPTSVIMTHSRSVSGATFSPDGQFLVSLAYDDTMQIFRDIHTATSDADAAAARTCVFHRNNNTGRWLTKFRAFFDPKAPNTFAVGCMMQPRRVELYAAPTGPRAKRWERTKIDNPELLQSVQSVHAFHPRLNVIASSNSSGRVHLFR